MADTDPLWMQVLNGELRSDQIIRRNPSTMDVCRICGVRPEYVNGRRLDMRHDAAKHGIGPDSTPTPRTQEPLRMPRRIGGRDYDIFGDKS